MIALCTDSLGDTTEIACYAVGKVFEGTKFQAKDSLCEYHKT